MVMREEEEEEEEQQQQQRWNFNSRDGSKEPKDNLKFQPPFCAPVKRILTRHLPSETLYTLQMLQEH